MIERGMEKVKAFLAQHPLLQGAVRAAEGGAIGALIDIPFTPHVLTAEGVRQLGVAAMAGAGIALRNWLKDNYKTQQLEKALRA